MEHFVREARLTEWSADAAFGVVVGPAQASQEAIVSAAATFSVRLPQAVPSADRAWFPLGVLKPSHRGKLERLQQQLFVPLEIAPIRDACGKDFVILTPGIRPAGADAGDQRRTMTPRASARSPSAVTALHPGGSRCQPSSSAAPSANRFGHVSATTAQHVRDEFGLPRELTPHGLRHSYVTHLIEDGFDPLFVQMQVGHRHASTTAIYTSVSSDYRTRVLRSALE